MLPEKFAIYYSNTQEFKNYIEWLNKKIQSEHWVGNDETSYYGMGDIDRGNRYKGSFCMSRSKGLPEGVVELSLEQWREALKEIPSYEIF